MEILQRYRDLFLEIIQVMQLSARDPLLSTKQIHHVLLSLHFLKRLLNKATIIWCTLTIQAH